MISDRLVFNFHIAVEAVKTNKLRSLLTALGIIFGVAAVISMLAIGSGAQQEILDQIKLVGVNNIVIKPVVEQEEQNLEEENVTKEKKKFSPGLTLRDLSSINKIIPGIAKTSPEVMIETHIIKNGVRRSAKLVGVEPAYFDIANFEVTAGKLFNAYQLRTGAPVCIIGRSIKSKFFPKENPIGKSIKCGQHWLKIVGILNERFISKQSISKLGIRDYNMDVYTPLQTVLLRYTNRDLVTRASLIQYNARNRSRRRGETMEKNKSKTNYHQLDRLVLQVEETSQINAIVEILSRMLERRHFGVVDFEITVPELLLKQQQKTKRIFNFVLGAIAGISLLVGGIGIMNIMLASVMERIKEIGLRLSIGAQKKDIVLQFVFEAMMISITGGLIGIVLGIVIAVMISKLADIPTIISIGAVFLAFSVAATVGLIFGIAPARKAASQDPITSLRYE